MTITDVMLTPLAFKVRGTMRNLHPTTMPLWSLVKGVQESRHLAELTAQGRALPREQFKEWKPKNLMAVYLAPRFRDNEGRPDTANVAGYTGLAGFDFDDVDPGEVLGALRGVPQVVCAGVSASGRGVWCCARVAAATAQEYALCFAEGVTVFKAAGLPGIDVGAHDPTRARFVASSPECWWRWDAIEDIPAFLPVGDLTTLSNPKKRAAPKVKVPKGYNMSPELAFDEARNILSEVPDVPEGCRDNTIAQECGRLKALAACAGVSPAAYAGPLIAAWDARGYPHKKTVSIVTRLLLGGGKS